MNNEAKEQLLDRINNRNNNSLKPNNKIRIRGAGDLVALVANPIKQVILNHTFSGSYFHQKLENCNCPERQKWLNEHIPF